MRIAFDVSPLSHERTGVNNYLRGSLRGLAEAAPVGRDRRVRADVPARAGGDPRGARRASTSSCGCCRCRPRTPSAPRGRSRGRPAAERWLGAFDALHFSDWLFPPQRAGVRATTIHDIVPHHHPEWTTSRTRAMHERKYRNAARTCDVDLRELGVHRRRLQRRVLVPARADARRASGDRRRVHRRRAKRPISACRTCSPSRRSSRARTSRRSCARSSCSPTPTSCSRSRAAPAGASSRSSTGAASSGSGASPTRSSRGSTAVQRPSSTRRASKGSACRSPRRWRAVRPSSRRPIRRWTRRRATRRCAPIPTIRRRSRTRFATALVAARRAARARARARRDVLVAADGRDLPRGVPAIRVALDTTPLRQTRAGTARYVRGLRDHLAADVVEAVVSGDVARCAPPPAT